MKATTHEYQIKAILSTNLKEAFSIETEFIGKGREVFPLSAAQSRNNRQVRVKGSMVVVRRTIVVE